MNEFATLQFTSRRAPDLMDTSLKGKLRPRSVKPEHYNLILALRNSLARVADSTQSKHRCTVIEFAAMAFAVRVARKFTKFETPSGLERKLEIHLKRAKRLAIRALDKATYDTAAQEWKRSSRWIRFNLLPLSPARGCYKPREIYAQQFRTMFGFAKALIAERCAESLPDFVIARLTKLIVREIRRGRHPGVTVRELATNEPRSKDFLFRLMRKKQVDLKLKFEFMLPVEQSAARSERFPQGNDDRPGPDGDIGSGTSSLALS